MKDSTEMGICLVASGMFLGAGVALGLWSFCFLVAVVIFIVLMAMEKGKL